jgi:RNA polymerase sigma-70 factor (ECF subfamily)
VVNAVLSAGQRAPAHGEAARCECQDERLFAVVYRHMRKLAGSGAPDLDDLVQTAAERVIRGASSFEGKSELSTWTYSVCYRVLLAERRWYRRWARRFTLEPDPIAAAPEQPTPAALTELGERARCVRRAVARMSDKYRTVVVLHDVEEFSTAEIARIVDAKETTVRSRLRDGRKQLLELLRRDPACETIGGTSELAHTQG